MSLLPELIKNLGPEGVLIALTVILAGGGIMTYFLWRFTTEILRMYRDLSQQALQNQRTDARQLAKEIKQSYEAGYQSARQHEREDAEDRTPTGGTRITKE